MGGVTGFEEVGVGGHEWHRLLLYVPSATCTFLFHLTKLEVPAKMVPSHQGTLQSIAQLNQLGARSLVSDWSNTADT